MPQFDLLLPDSATIVRSETFPVGSPILVIFFSPDCEHCQEETKSIVENIDQLRNIKIYFVTIDPIDRLKVFNDYYHLARYPNITVGRDYKFGFPKSFPITTTPYMVLYNRNKQQKSIIKGRTDISNLVAQVNAL